MIPIRGAHRSTTYAMPFPVKLYIYDLSQGMATQLAPMLGFPIEGIWHTALVVHGFEWYFGGGGGIVHSLPGTTELREPLRIIELGATDLNLPQLQDYLSTLGRERFRGDRYHLFENNCNNFSDVVARHLTGKGIPGYILELPEMVKNSPIAQLIAPIIEQATPTVGDSVHGTSPSNSSSVVESAAVKFVHFPHKDFITFPQKIDREKVEGKLRELNLKNGDTLNEAQLSSILMLIDSPKSLDKDRWGDFRPLFESWPPSDLFPGLDVMRHVTAATDLDSETAKELLAHCYNLLSPTTSSTCLQLCLKVVCNLFPKHKDTLLTKYRDVMVAKINGILEEAEELPPVLQTVLASVSLNYAVVYSTDTLDSEASVQIVSALATTYLGRINASEALYRTVVALGTLVVKDSEARDLALALDAGNTVDRIKRGQTEKLDQCLKECLEVLSD